MDREQLALGNCESGFTREQREAENRTNLRWHISGESSEILLVDLDEHQVQDLRDAIRGVKQYIALIRSNIQQCQLRNTEFEEAKTLCNNISRECKGRMSEAKSRSWRGWYRCTHCRSN